MERAAVHGRAQAYRGVERLSAAVDAGCSAAVAPNSTSVGRAGTGNPSDAASAFAKTSAGPWPHGKNA
ncbi:MAG TPA: hypothetical protein VF446_05820 [Trinickia sp.]